MYACIVCGHSSFLSCLCVQRTDHRRSAVTVGLHCKRAGDHAGAILHNAQSHSLMLVLFLGETDPVVFYPEDDQIVLNEKIDDDKFRFAMLDSVPHGFLSDAVKMCRHGVVMHEYRRRAM